MPSQKDRRQENKFQVSSFKFEEMQLKTQNSKLKTLLQTMFKPFRVKSSGSAQILFSLFLQKEKIVKSDVWSRRVDFRSKNSSVFVSSIFNSLICQKVLIENSSAESERSYFVEHAFRSWNTHLSLVKSFMETERGTPWVPLQQILLFLRVFIFLTKSSPVE